MTESSLEAFDFIQPGVVSARWRTLMILRMMHRATCSELEAALKGKHQSVSSRLDELTLMGLVSPEFGKRERANQPSESIYGLTPDATRILSDRERAYEVFTQMGAIYTDKTQERTDALRALKREWRAHIREACVEEGLRLCPLK